MPESKTSKGAVAEVVSGEVIASRYPRNGRNAMRHPAKTAINRLFSVITFRSCLRKPVNHYIETECKQDSTSMDYLVQLLFSTLLGYLLGSIPFGLVLTRLFNAGDLRSIGSGNIGATNVLRTGNKGLAALTLVLDLLKGLRCCYPVVISRTGMRTAGRSRRFFRASLSGLAPVQRRQGCRDLCRYHVWIILAGRACIRRSMDIDPAGEAYVFACRFAGRRERAAGGIVFWSC